MVEESMFTTPGQWSMLEDEQLPYFSGSPEPGPEPPAMPVAEVSSHPTTPPGPEEAPASTSSSKPKPRRNTEAKINFMLDALQEVNWTLGDFLYCLFRPPSNERRKKVPPRSVRHGTVVGTYLGGGMNHTVAELVGFWLEDPSSRAKRDSKDGEYGLKFSPSEPWKDMKHAHAALTSMAIQLCESHLVREQRIAVRGVNGLHGTAATARGHRRISWEDISSRTFAQVTDILSTHQPCTLHMVKRLATPTPRTDGAGDVIQRKRRPPDIVATEVLSILNFSHTMFARLLPAAQSILWFGCKVERPIFNFTSRVGITQGWGTSYNLLARLAEEAGEAVAAVGRDPLQWLFCVGDNAQRGHKQREMRMGRENSMKVGFAATAMDAIDFDGDAPDLDDHLRRVAQNLRAQLNPDGLRDMIDFAHIEVALELQWLQVLTNYVPSLARYKPAVVKLFETEGAKLIVPPHKTRIRPLAPAAKNESITTELRDALIDILGQLGQHANDYVLRVFPIGGDGLTFEKAVLLKQLLQFQTDPFQRFDLIYPFLETWHAQWTYLSLIYESHFGPLLSNDPSSLGHSATKINQKRPSNLSKVDYYPALYTAYIVLDARMLDCWRTVLISDHDEDLFAHFEHLDERDIPSLETLREHARTLHNRYSTQQAWVMAMQGGDAALDAGWVSGDPWTPVSDEQQVEQVAIIPPAAEEDKDTSPRSASSTESESESSSSHASSGGGESEAQAFSGDRTLAQSILFMRDAMVSRDTSHAVAVGDVGRMWEDLKMMMYNFAGSTHSKYTTYLLEMICILELESSPSLRDAFLRNWLVNPSGQPGRAMEGDLYQEHLNRELEEAISRGGSEWDSRFIQKVVAPNVQHFIELKNEWGTGVGLAERRGRHSVPHSRPEIRTLLATYKAEHLHSFRRGRIYTAQVSPNTFRDGVVNLEKSKLAKFVSDTMRTRVPRDTGSPVAEPIDMDAILLELDEADDDELENDEDNAGPTRGRVELEDGELVISLSEADEMSASEWVLMGEAEEQEAEAWHDEDEEVEDHDLT
ncbi:hypothetical protein LXA43DRAFT_1105136 [Ganoderma leucocontextum]|nr:hypothetical protein LXA43DRAFT_1105136 [Ganoderma leucocontextum]